MGLSIPYCVVVSLLAISSSSLASSPNLLRLNSSLVHPYHYDIELQINVDSKKFYVEEIIELRILEDIQELQINNNRVDGDWLKSRLVNQDTLETFVPSIAYTIYDDVNEILYLQFASVVPGSANYSLYLTGVNGAFGLGLSVVPLETDR